MQTQNIQRNSSHKQGFTFIETLVAITILLIAVVAPMSLAQDGIVAARLAQDQIVAFYLAQEGVEVVRNMRDENKLDGDEQMFGVLGLCEVNPLIGTDVGCYIDATHIIGSTFNTVACSVSGCIPIRKTDDRYNYQTGDDTKYIREIRTWYVEDPDPKEMVVEVKVTWPFLNSTRTYTLRDNLLDW